MSTFIHMCIATRVLVRMLKSHEASPSELFKDYTGTRAQLIAELEKTPERVYPLGECDNFDDTRGCLGHRKSEPVTTIDEDEETHEFYLGGEGG
jgi:hypothetical protein